jgi:hypothetical protein
MQAKQFELLKALFKRQNAANDGDNSWNSLFDVKIHRLPILPKLPKESCHKLN